MRVRGAYMSVEEFLYTYKKGMIYTGENDIPGNTWCLEAGRRLIIPDYQREYRWEEKQLTELFEDIDKGNCYLGQIAAARNYTDPLNYFLVDGQQRITSIVILLTVLNREFYLQKDTANIRKYELHDKENNNDADMPRLDFQTNCFSNFQGFLKQIYQMDNTELETGSFEKPLRDDYRQTKRYIDACVSFHSQLENHMNLYNSVPKKLQYVKELIGKILNTQISVAIFEGNNSFESERVFLDINEKGLRLDNEDILKAYYFQSASGINGMEALETWKKLKENYFSLKECIGTKGIPIETYVNYALQIQLLTTNEELIYKNFDSDLRYKEKNGKKHICLLFTDTELHDSMKKIVDFFSNFIGLLENECHSRFYKEYVQTRDSTNRAVFKMLFKSIGKSDMNIVYMAFMKFWWLRKSEDQALTVEDIIELFAFYVICNLSGLKKEKTILTQRFISAQNMEDLYEVLHGIEIQMFKTAQKRLTVLKSDQDKAEYLSFNIQMFYNEFVFDKRAGRWKLSVSNQDFLDKYDSNRKKFVKDHFLIQNGKEIRLLDGSTFKIDRGMAQRRRGVFNFIYHYDNFENKDFVGRLKEIRHSGGQNRAYGKYENAYFDFIEKQMENYFEINTHMPEEDKWKEIEKRYLEGLPEVFPKLVFYILEENISAWNLTICREIQNRFPEELLQKYEPDL